MKILNELLKLDRVAITELCKQRVLTNGAFDNHPTVQVMQSFDRYTSYLGLLGIFNYLFSYINSNNEREYVIAVYDKSGLITEFVRQPLKKD